jgi:acyl-coenzyme A synthetase/AMP-(fatty) acid ligase
MNLLSVWQATVRRDPTAPAVYHSNRVWTRQELDELGRGWSALTLTRLFSDRERDRTRTRRSALGTTRSTLARRALFFSEPNGPAWFERFLGILYLGAVPAPLDPGEPAAAQRAIARSAGGAGFAAAAGLEPVPGSRIRRWPAALLKTTSGSVGRPKALGFSAEQMQADGRQVMQTMGIGPGDLNFAVIPLGHSYGLGNLVLPLIARGTALICCTANVPHGWAREIRTLRPTVFPAVPPVLDALAESDVPGSDLASLRVVISAGSPLPPAVAARFHQRFDRRVHNFYGSSETGGIAYDRSGECTLSGRSVGRPLRGVKLRFGASGRFVVESAAVVGGSFQPADRGGLNPQGELVLLGRTGRTIKLAGRRVDLAEVEKALLRVPGVSGAAVLLPPGGRGLAAAVTGAPQRGGGPGDGAHVRAQAPQGARPGAAATLSGRALAAALQVDLAAWKIPRRWQILERLPVNARGKVDRRALQRLFA